MLLSLSRLLRVGAFLPFVAFAAHAQSNLQKSSPFVPLTSATTANPSGAKYQLGGMMNQGKDTLVSITRVSDKQSFWVPVGGTVDEVTVNSYDPATDQAIITANGEKLTLTLRKPTVVTGAVATNSPQHAPESVAVTPPLPPPSGPPEVQEREARMLVTDLLEIGQQQRKAYEEAQKQAAAQKQK